MITQSPNCPLFKLPGELRTRIYEMAFEDPEDSNIVDVGRDFPKIAPTLAAMRIKRYPRYASLDALIQRFSDDSPFTRVIPSPPKLLLPAPPCAALLLTCQRVHAETRFLFVDAYRRYCAKDFFIDFQDIWNEDELTAYLDFVPTDHISTFKLNIPEAKVAYSFLSDSPVEVTLSRKKGGQWRASATCATTANVEARNIVLIALDRYLQRLRSVKHFCRVCMGPCGNKSLLKSKYVRPYIESKSTRKCNRATKWAIKYRRKVAYRKSKHEWSKKATNMQEEHRNLRGGPEGPLRNSDLCRMLSRWARSW